MPSINAHLDYHAIFMTVHYCIQSRSVRLNQENAGSQIKIFSDKEVTLINMAAYWT